jgi:hypothetical protein
VPQGIVLLVINPKLGRGVMAPEERARRAHGADGRNSFDPSRCFSQRDDACVSGQS